MTQQINDPGIARTIVETLSDFIEKDEPMQNYVLEIFSDYI